MSVKKSKKINSGKKYYILDSSSAITPVDSYEFDETEIYLESLVDSECFLKTLKNKENESRLEELTKKMGFEWDPLSESGQMRQLPYATTIMEAIEKYNWMTVREFCNEQDLSLYRISGGELFDPSVPEVKKQIEVLSKTPGLYGSNQYNVVINEKERVLRYNACMQKLSIAKGINLSSENIPIGLFEISKSYRFEEEDELQLCKRVRSFHIPELDVIHDSMASSLKMALVAHKKILDEISKFDSEYELLCSVTQDFVEESLDFLTMIAKSIDKPILLAVYEDLCCKDGVKIDIEYHTFDSLRSPVEIATCLVDDGSSVFSLDLKYKTKSGVKKPVSLLHVVFPFSSIERSAYFFIDRAIRKEKETGLRQFPFWVAPIQIRIIARDNGSLENAKKLAKEFDLSGFRVDVDDREISYNIKKKEEELKWIPYMVSVDGKDKNFEKLVVENKAKWTEGKTMKKNELIEEMKVGDVRNISVPCYVPMLLSKRINLN